ILHNPARGMFSISSHREMVCEQSPNSLDTMHKRIREISVLKARAYCFDPLLPETLSAFRVNPDVANDRKAMCARSHKQQYVVSQCGAIHLESLETTRRFGKCVSNILVTDEHENLPGCALLGCCDRGQNLFA